MQVEKNDREVAGEVVAFAIAGNLNRLLSIAVRLRIPDILLDGPRSITQLAQQTGANEGALYRILRALVSIGFFEEQGARSFGNSERSRLLCEEVEGSLRDFVLWEQADWLNKAWTACEHTVRTGRPSFNYVYRTDFWTWLAEHPHIRFQFHELLKSSSLPPDRLLSMYDFSNVQKMVDVGGGDGTVLCGVLKAYPSMEGILFDMPDALVNAQHVVEVTEGGDRCHLQAGNFFEAIPAGADLYFLQSVLHDWNDEDCLKILRTCRNAMSSRSKLLLAERIFPAEKAPMEAVCFDLWMLFIFGGKERTAEEFRALLELAGLRVERVIQPEASVHGLIECTL